MQEIFNYINKYGNLSFGEKTFNEIDNVIFSQLIYTDFENIVKNDEKVLLSEAAMEFFSIHSNEELENLIGISEKSARLLMECAKTRRFGKVLLCNYVNHVNEEIDKQFSAINFILDDGSLLVAFRGTDVTVTGVKESAMLSYMFPVPAQIEALHYFQETAMLTDGDIRICGHSKGGNLAVFAAVNCSNSLKKRIVGVYEDDAPGFPKWFFERYDYKQIENRIFLLTPQTSIIGRMLYHNVEPIIVESSNNGLRQHQVSSWKIDDSSFVRMKKYDSISNFTSDYINDLIEYIGDDDLQLFFDTIEYVAENMGIDDFYDLQTKDFKKAFALIDSISELDNEKKERFKLIIKKTISDFTKEYLSIKAKEYIDRYKNSDNR